MASLQTPSKGKTEKKTAAAPVKATMNFARRKTEFNYKKMLPLIAVLIIVAVLFVKFGILDPIDTKVTALTELSTKQAQLAIINAKLSGYDELYNQYGRYSYGWMSETEKNTVSRMDILNLVEKKIMPMAVIEDLGINNNVLTLNLTGITLEQTSTMVKILEQDELVESASVYSASAEGGKEASVLMSVILTTDKEAE